MKVFAVIGIGATVVVFVLFGCLLWRALRGRPVPTKDDEDCGV